MRKDLEPAEGTPRKQPLVRTTLFLSKEQSVALDLLAVQEDTSKGRLLRQAVAEYLDRHPVDPARLEAVATRVSHSEPHHS